MCSRDVSWSLGVVTVAGSLDTVTIFGPGDFDKWGEPLGMECVPILTGLTASTDFSSGDIWLLPLGENVAEFVPFSASLTSAVTACVDEKPMREAPTFCPGELVALIGLAATAALSWLKAAARARGEA